MLQVITDGVNGDLAEAYLDSDDFLRLRAELDTVKESPDKDLKFVYEAEFAIPARKRWELNNKRLQLIYWRSPAYNYLRISVSVLISFILGSILITMHAV